MAEDEEDDKDEVEEVEALLVDIHNAIHYKAPRWLDLSCGHDFTWHPSDDDIAPTRLGDMARCPKCEIPVVIWGLNFTDTDTPAFDAMKIIAEVVNEEKEAT